MHVRGIGLGSASDADVLARAVDDGRTLVTENAADLLPLLDQRQSAGVTMAPVLVASTAGRGVGGALHARLAGDIDNWAASNADPYAHAHWLPLTISRTRRRRTSGSTAVSHSFRCSSPQVNDSVAFTDR